MSILEGRSIVNFSTTSIFKIHDGCSREKHVFLTFLRERLNFNNFREKKLPSLFRLLRDVKTSLTKKKEEKRKTNSGRSK